MLCMFMQSMQVMKFCTKYNTFNAVYVDTVDANLYKLRKHSMLCILMELMQLIYIVDSNTKYSNYMKLQLKGLNYNKM